MNGVHITLRYLYAFDSRSRRLYACCFGERRLETSWVHQIATALVFNSSVIFFGSHPKTMLDNPAVKLLKQIPATWDETVVLPSSRIGEVAAFARRSGKTWFLAVLNGQNEHSLQFLCRFWVMAGMKGWC